MRWPRPPAALAVGTALLAATWLGSGHAEAGPAAQEGAAWLAELKGSVAAELTAGKPLVVHAHVALCDNRIIPCGNPRLGNGDEPKKNLYWAVTGGFRGWHQRKGSGWTQLALDPSWKRPEHVLDVAVYRRRFAPDASWRELGVKAPFDVILVGWAWRGVEIDRMLEAYVEDLYGTRARTLRLQDGSVVAAGGASHIVAYVGHNRWMDREPYDFAAAARRAGSSVKRKGTVAIACKTEDYLGAEVPSASRVPLVLTRDFMFAGSTALEGAVRAFAQGGSLAEIRTASAQAYADGGKKELRRVKYAFTNPSDPKWKRQPRR